QFFNKTRRNVEENPIATVLFHDPITFEAWRLRLRFLRAETSGPLFDAMALRIQVIASHTGMAGVFRLLSADVYEVLELARIDGFLTAPAPALEDAPPEALPAGPMTEIRGLQSVSERISRAHDLDELLNGTLLALDHDLGFAHTMVLLQDECTRRL